MRPRLTRSILSDTVMSIPTLPREVLGIILSFVHAKIDPPTSESQATFSSLCLSSKHFLPLAREHLYYRPFNHETKITWAQAKDLHKTLSQNNGHLGRHVRSLEGIVPCFLGFSKTTNPWRFSPNSVSLLPLFDLFHEVTRWYVAVIEACPQLVEIELCEGTSSTLDRIETALQGTTSTLRVVSFSNTSKRAGDNRPQMITERIGETLSRPCLRNITTVKLLDLGSRSHGWILHPKWMTPSDTRRSLEPHALPRFRSLRILGDASYLDHLPQIVPSIAVPSLCHYEFVPDIFESGCRPSLERYAFLCHFGNDVAMFRAFANLTSITINNSRGCFRDLLATLSSSTPLLELVDFHGSHWIQRNDASLRRGGIKSFEERYVPACSKSEVETLLQGFNSLRYTDLGVLPTTNPDDYEGLGNDLKGKGVTIVWDHFRVDEPCLKCGAVHE
ncbi:hypothetical protein JCM5353_006425 [Sporobolomyces roseus]